MRSAQFVGRAGLVLLSAAATVGADHRVWAQPAASSATRAASPGETALWESVRNSSDPDDVQAYLDAYPQGAFAGLARDRLAALPGRAAPASQQRAATPAAAPAPPSRSAASTPVAGAPAAGTACDRLAEPPHGSMGNLKPSFTPNGIADDQVDLKAARAACTAAMAEKPNEPRFVAYLARVLDQSDQIPESKRLYRQAADAGNAFAAYVVGGDYLLGRDGLAADEALGMRYLRQAAVGGVAYTLEPLAQWSLEGAHGMPQDAQEAARLYRLAADQGYAAAQVGLAKMYEAGAGGLPRDQREAFRLYRLASAQGNADARAAVERLQPKPPNNPAAAAAVAAAAAQPVVVAPAPAPSPQPPAPPPLADAHPAPGTQCDQLAEPLPILMAEGSTLFTPTGLEDRQLDTGAVQAACAQAMAEYPDEPRFVAYSARALLATGHEPEAVRLFRLAAQRGNAYAQIMMTYGYEHGLFGLPQDNSETVRYLRMAATQGASRALVRLAAWEAEGMHGLPVNPEDAARLYLHAADLKDPEGLVGYAFMVAQGAGGLKRDLAQALQLFRQAADQGEPSGSYWAGRIYERGYGVPKDEQAAARLYKAAADSGYAQAQYQLGLMYEQGRGGLPRDHATALRLWKAAADGGSSEARTQLAAQPSSAPAGRQPTRK